MNKNLLLVTGDAYFGKILLQNLEREGYRVHTVKGKGEAVVRADEQNCSLAFLDADLGYKAVSEIGRALRFRTESMTSREQTAKEAWAHWRANASDEWRHFVAQVAAASMQLEPETTPVHGGASCES